LEQDSWEDFDGEDDDSVGGGEDSDDEIYNKLCTYTQTQKEFVR